MTTPFNKLPWKLELIGEAGVLAVVCENVLPEISGTRVVDLAKMFIGALKKRWKKGVIKLGLKILSVPINISIAFSDCRQLNFFSLFPFLSCSHFLSCYVIL